jgi:hypothetical protein
MAEAAAPAAAGGAPAAGAQAGGAAAGGAPAGGTPAGDAPAGAAGPAKGVGAGVANLGGVSTTNDLLRSARASIGGYANVVGGNAERDINVYYQTAPAAGWTVRPVAAEQCDAVRAAFAAPDGFADLVGAVTSQHVVVLRAAPRHGGETAALRLLVDLGATTLYRLDPNQPLDAVPKDQFEKSGGYLLSGLSDAALKSLRGYDLEGLDALLRPLQARLVVVVPTGMSLADQAVSGYVQHLGRPPEPAVLVEHHLRWRLGSARAATELLAGDGVAAALAELAAAEPCCRDAADLARLLCESSTATGAADLEWVRDRMRERAVEDFDGWFDSLDDMPLRCLALALALLNGLPFEIVTFAAARLRRRLEEPLLGRTTAPDLRVVNTLPARPDPFRDTRAARLRRLRAQITQTTIPAWFGDTPAQVMSYADASYAPAVLNRVWEEYDEVRPILVEWFHDLGGHPSEAVRVWVATAVGMLANRAFGHILTEIIEPWAEVGTVNHREAAAVALNVPATTGGLYDQVQRVVRGWGHPDSTDELRATAARAYGASLGQAAPAQAIAALEYLADSDDNSLANAIGKSLAELMDWDPTLTPKVLTAIVYWLADRRHHERSTTAHVAFLVIAIELTREPEQVGADDDTVRWPTLLHLADTDDSLAPTIAGLWHAVLNGPLHEDAYWVFGSWAVMAEPDARPCGALGDLAAVIAKDDRTRKILLQLAADWTTGKNPEPTPRAAASVLAAVSDRSPVP